MQTNKMKSTRQIINWVVVLLGWAVIRYKFGLIGDITGIAQTVRSEAAISVLGGPALGGLGGEIGVVDGFLMFWCNIDIGAWCLEARVVKSHLNWVAMNQFTNNKHELHKMFVEYIK